MRTQNLKLSSFTPVTHYTFIVLLSVRFWSNFIYTFVLNIYELRFLTCKPLSVDTHKLCNVIYG